jgi:hypothetical protein
MARRKPVVPGATDPEATVDPTPPAPRSRKRAVAADPDVAGSAPAAALPPKIVEAVASATHMSVAQAQELDSKGALPERVLTPQGWYIPKSNEAVG